MILSRIQFIAILVLLFTACSPKPYKEAKKIQQAKIEETVIEMETHIAPILTDTLGNIIPSTFIPTVNFGSRKPIYVILHHTAQDSIQQTIKTFTLESTQVSSHYIISRDGSLVQMLNDNLRAWHAGAGKWGNITDLNSVSIGIELDNNGFEPYPETQINTLLLLLAKLKADYNIPTTNFIGHADISPSRKIDPNVNFPWATLAKNGFGLWYNLPDKYPPLNFDVKSALRIIGYDVSNLSAAIVAFKRHFIQTDISPTLTDWDRCVLYELYNKYQ
jgi:N-acetylmuramoyl-L-alanine amidase